MQQNLYFSTAGQFYFVSCLVIFATTAYTDEASSRSRYKVMWALQVTHERVENILNTLMPLGVVDEIRNTSLEGPTTLPSHHYNTVTVAYDCVKSQNDDFTFCTIYDLTTFRSRC